MFLKYIVLINAKKPKFFVIENVKGMLDDKFKTAFSTMLLVDLKVEQISHKVDQLHTYMEEILHDQNYINEQQEQTNQEIAVQIDAINDSLDQLCDTKSQTHTLIDFKTNDNKQ